jgi:hypothetical protein
MSAESSESIFFHDLPYRLALEWFSQNKSGLDLLQDIARCGVMLCGEVEITHACRSWASCFPSSSLACHAPFWPLATNEL